MSTVDTGEVELTDLMCDGCLRSVKAVNQLHHVTNNLIHAEYNQCYNDGSDKHDDCALEQLRPGGPGSFIPELGIAFLKIRK